MYLGGIILKDLSEQVYTERETDTGLTTKGSLAQPLRGIHRLLISSKNVATGLEK